MGQRRTNQSLSSTPAITKITFPAFFFSGNGRRSRVGLSERLTNEGSPDLDARAGRPGMMDVSWQMCFLSIFVMDGQQEAF